MEITVEQKFDSGETTDDSTDLLYIIRGTDDGEAAKQAMLDAAPATHNSMSRSSYGVEWLSLTDWLGRMEYASPEALAPVPLQTGESSFSFDTGGGTQHVTQAFVHIGSYVPADKTAEDFKGAIGVGGDGDNITVEGVDITVPVYHFSETYAMPDSLVTADYIQDLVTATGRMNIVAYKGFARGEVLFLGASGAKRGGGDWEITFRFAVSRNRTEFTVGDITVPGKVGWDYMHVRYGTKLGSKRWVKQPIQVEISQVYKYHDMTVLKI